MRAEPLLLSKTMSQTKNNGCKPKQTKTFNRKHNDQHVINADLKEQAYHSYHTTNKISLIKYLDNKITNLTPTVTVASAPIEVSDTLIIPQYLPNKADSFTVGSPFDYFTFMQDLACQYSFIPKTSGIIFWRTIHQLWDRFFPKQPVEKMTFGQFKRLLSRVDRTKLSDDQRLLFSFMEFEGVSLHQHKISKLVQKWKSPVHAFVRKEQPWKNTSQHEFMVLAVPKFRRNANHPVAVYDHQDHEFITDIPSVQYELKAEKRVRWLNPPIERIGICWPKEAHKKHCFLMNSDQIPERSLPSQLTLNPGILKNWKPRGRKQYAEVAQVQRPASVTWNSSESDFEWTVPSRSHSPQCEPIESDESIGHDTVDEHVVPQHNPNIEIREYGSAEMLGYIKNVLRIPTNISRISEGMANTSMETGRAAAESANLMQTLYESANKALGNLMPLTNITTFLARFGTDLVMLKVIDKVTPQFTRYAMIATALKFLLTPKSWGEVLADLPRLLREYVAETRSDGGQAEAKFEDFSDRASKTAIFAGACSMFNTKPCYKLLKIFERTCDFTWKTERGLTAFPKLLEQVRVLFHKVYTLIMGDQGLSQAEVFLHGDYPEFRKWVMDCDKWSDPTRLDLAARQPALRQEVRDLRTKSGFYLNRINTPNCPQTLTTSFMIVHRMIQDVYNKVCTMDETDHNKFDPFCIMLVGKAGSGKTHTLSSVGNAICDLENVPADASARMYYRNSASQYWDQYHHEFCTLFEDWFQVKEGPLAETQMSEFITLKGVNKSALNMAHLEDKGKSFSSKVILMTSNVAYPSPNMIASKEALWRRRDVLAVLDIIPSCRTTDGKINKIALAELIDSMSPAEYEYNQYPHLLFRILPSAVQTPTPDQLDPDSDMNWPQFRSKVLDLWEVHRDNNNRSLAALNNIAQPGRDWRNGVAQHDPARDIERRSSEIFEQQEVVPIDPLVTPFLDEDGSLRLNTNLVDFTSSEFSKPDVMKALSYCKLEQKDDTGLWDLVYIDEQHARAPIFCQAIFYALGGISVHKRVELWYMYKRWEAEAKRNENNGNPWAQVRAVDRLLRYVESTNLRIDAWWTNLSNRWQGFYNDHPLLANGIKAFIVGSATLASMAGLCKAIIWLFGLEFPEDEYDIMVMPNGQMFYVKKQNSLEAEGDIPTPKTRREKQKLRAEGKSFKLSDDFDKLYPKIKPIINQLEAEASSEEDGSNEFLDLYMDYYNDLEEVHGKISPVKVIQKMMIEEDAFFPLCKLHYPEFYAIFVACKENNPTTPYLGKLVLEGYDDKKIRSSKKASPTPRMVVEMDNTVRKTTSQLIAEGYDDKRVRSPKAKSAAPRMRIEADVPLECEAAFNVEAEAEGTSDPGAEEVARLISRNSYEVAVLETGKPGYLGKTCGVFVRERELLVPFHLAALMTVGRQILIRAPRVSNGFGVQSQFYVTKRMVERVSSEVDAAIVHCPESVPAHRNILRHFPRNMTFMKGQVPVYMVVPSRDAYVLRTGKARQMQEFKDQNPILRERYTSEQGDVYIAHKGYWHDVPTDFGFCGAVLIARDVTIPAKILGIHVAGKFNVDGGFATTLSREMIERKLAPSLEQIDLLEFNEFVYPGDGTAESLTPTLTVSGEQLFLGIANDGPHQSTLTCLRKTKIHGLAAPSTKGPAPLSANDPRVENEYSPLEMAFNKFSIKGTDPDPRLVEELQRQDAQYDIANMPPADEDVRVVSWSLVLQGRPEPESNNILYGPMNISSSSGYPWQKFAKGAPGKTYYINNDDDTNWYIQNDQLKIAIRDRIDHWIERKAYPSPWAGQLKDELRSHAKIKNGETRLFTAGPIDFQIVARIFSIHWVAAVHKSYMAKNSYSRVGIDMASGDATAFIKKHLEVGTDVIAGDHADFDGQLLTPFVVSVFEEIFLWYEHYSNVHKVGTPHYFEIPTFDKDLKPCTKLISIGQFHNALYVCGSEVWSTTLMIGRNVFIKSGGNTSGNNLTVYINNKVNRKYILMAWYAFCFRENKLEWLTKFDEMTRLSVYGDDIYLSVQRELLRAGFDFYFIRDCLAEYGLKFTDPNKSSNPPPHVHYLDATFLKRSFRVDEEFPDIYVPMMAEETIHELVNWQRKSSYKSEEEALYENIENSLRFAVYHGEKYYYDWLSKINESLDQVGLSPAKDIYFEERCIFLQKCGKAYFAPGREPADALKTRDQNGPTMDVSERW